MKNSMHRKKRGGERIGRRVSRFFRIFVSRYQKFSLEGTFVFPKLLVWKKQLMDRNLGGGGGYHVFPSERFCRTVPKKL